MSLRKRSSSMTAPASPKSKFTVFFAKSKAKMSQLLSPKISSEPQFDEHQRGGACEPFTSRATQPRRRSRPYSRSVDSIFYRPFTVNDIVLNRYMLTRKMTSVDACRMFIATDLATQQPVTIKICPKTDDMEREIELCQLFAPDGDSKGIIHVQSKYDMPSEDCIIVIASHCHGNLDEFMGWSSRQPTVHRFVSEKLLRNLAGQLAHGLKTIHDHGWLHGSIRPENILVRVVSRAIPYTNEHSLLQIDEMEEEKRPPPMDDTSNQIMKIVLGDDSETAFATPSPRSRACTSLGQLFETMSLDNIAEQHMDVLAWIGNLSSLVPLHGCVRTHGVPEVSRNQGRLCMTAPEILCDEMTAPSEKGKSDVFSLGCILWKCVYGVAPYGIRGDFDPISQSWGDWRYTPLPTPAMNSRQISLDLRELLLGMLELNVCKRLSLEDVIGHDWMS